MKKGFTRFWIVALSVILIVITLDFTFGKIMDWMLPQISNQGDIGKTYFALNDVETPVVIVGSSRASHHYVTQMIEDSLGMPAYNIGRDGCFYSYNCCVINSIMDRYKPKVIIWENGLEYLYEDSSDPLENLYPYFGSNRNVTNTINEELPWTELVRIRSNFYKYNSESHRIIMRYLSRNKFVDSTVQGYLPLSPKELRQSLVLAEEELISGGLSKTKVARFESILSRIHDMGVKLVVVDSPKYKIRNHEDESTKEMRRLCQLYGATFIDNSQIPFFLEHPEFFNDYTHLNDEGARIYTKLFIKQIESL